MRLSRTVLEILSLIFQKIKEVTWQWPRLFQGQFVACRLGLTIINMRTKFEVSSLSRSRDILGGAKYLKWVTWRDHAPFSDVLSSVCWDLLCAIHILSLKYLRLPATKKWKATPNVKILVLSHLWHSLGELGVTYTLARWKARGRLPINANSTFFAIFYGWGAKSKYWSKLCCLKGVGHFERKFQWKGEHPPTNFGVRKLESQGYHVVLFAWSYV